MVFRLIIMPEAKANLVKLERTSYLQKQCKAVYKAIKLLADNPRHPGLQTHRFFSLSGENGEKIYEAYAQNNAPGAYRIFFYYGPGKDTITITAITPHP